jgi:hypothetical protein
MMVIYSYAVVLYFLYLWLTSFDK